MVSSRVPRRISFEDYLLIDEASQERNEYAAGIIYAMTGGTITHARIGTNVVRTLGRLLSGKPCEPFATDLRVYIESVDVAAYPDATVYCGPIKTWRKRADVATNPTVVIEVLSPSTEAFDRGEKFGAYKRLPSLRDYVLVSQEQPLVEVFSRTPGDVWVPSIARGLDAAILIPSIEATLALSDVFERVDFSAP